MTEVPEPVAGDVGGVTISDAAIVKIVLASLKGIEGVGALGGGSGGVLSSLMGDKGSSGITVDVCEGTVDIDVSMAVLYGHNLPSVAEACRAAVKEQVESITGLKVRAVNVLVVDIQFPEEPTA